MRTKKVVTFEINQHSPVFFDVAAYSSELHEQQEEINHRLKRMEEQIRASYRSELARLQTRLPELEERLRQYEQQRADSSDSNQSKQIQTAIRSSPRKRRRRRRALEQEGGRSQNEIGENSPPNNERTRQMESDGRQRHEMLISKTTTSSETTHSATNHIPFRRRLGKKSKKKNGNNKTNERKKSGTTSSQKASRSGPAQHHPRSSAPFSSTTAAPTNFNYEHRTGLEPRPPGDTSGYMVGQVVEARSEFASIVPTLSPTSTILPSATVTDGPSLSTAPSASLRMPSAAPSLAESSVGNGTSTNHGFPTAPPASVSNQSAFGNNGLPGPTPTYVLSTDFAVLYNQVQKLSQALACVDTRNSNRNTLLFVGCNVNVRNNNPFQETLYANGYGNVIIGYNENFSCQGGSCARTGSHNLVVGQNNDWTGSGGLVAGESNKITGTEATITGGYMNLATGLTSHVVGVRFFALAMGYIIVDESLFLDRSLHVCFGFFLCLIYQGHSNLASGEDCVTVGGEQNVCSGIRATAVSGIMNEASGRSSAVLAGLNNLASGYDASVVGGALNTALGMYSTVASGTSNTASGMGSFVAGGQSNQANGTQSFVAGGQGYKILGTNQVVP